MTTADDVRSRSRPSISPPLPPGRARIGRRVVGGLFLWGGGVHVGILAADPSTYRGFADAALFGFVRDGWAEVFMAHPRAWAMALALAEMTAGILLLARGRAVLAGWAAVIVFHLLLMLFGFGFWLWCLPALATLSVLATADRAEWTHALSRRGDPDRVGHIP